MRGIRKEGDYTFIFIVFSQKAETDNILLLLDSQDLEVCICSVNTYSWCDWKAGNCTLHGKINSSPYNIM